MTYYNIWLYKNADNPQEPASREMYSKKNRARALSDARAFAKSWPLVELEIVEASDYDANDIQSANLVQTWKNAIPQIR